jgi:signal transduction histidine kinase
LFKQKENVMRKSIVTSTVAAAALFLGAGYAIGAAEFGSAAEAKKMLEHAVTELKVNEAAAVTKFNKADGEFRDRDLYLFCFNATTGMFNAHINSALLGTDIRLLKEKDGTPLGQKIFDGTKEGTIITVSYNFPKPNSTTPVPKESYVTRVGNEACGVGYYKS